MTVSPQARKKNRRCRHNRQVRAVTYEVAGKEKNGLYLPARGAIQCSFRGDRYHERWEIELGYRDIKKRDAAQRHHAEKQESGLGLSGAVGLLLGYNLVRREASQAAVAHQRAPNGEL